MPQREGGTHGLPDGHEGSKGWRKSSLLAATLQSHKRHTPRCCNRMSCVFLLLAVRLPPPPKQKTNHPDTAVAQLEDQALKSSIDPLYHDAKIYMQGPARSWPATLPPASIRLPGPRPPVPRSLLVNPCLPARPPACSCCTLSNESYDVWVAWTVAGVLCFVLALFCSLRIAWLPRARRRHQASHLVLAGSQCGHAGIALSADPICGSLHAVSMLASGLIPSQLFRQPM